MAGEYMLYGDPNIAVSLIKRAENEESLVEFSDGSRGHVLTKDLKRHPLTDRGRFARVYAGPLAYEVGTMIVAEESDGVPVSGDATAVERKRGSDYARLMGQAYAGINVWERVRS